MGMTLQDTLFNWLQIKIVSDARPEDNSAKETLDFFALILTEDHKLEYFNISDIDDSSIYVQYVSAGIITNQKFDRERSEQLLKDIEENPKYNWNHE